MLQWKTTFSIFALLYSTIERNSLQLTKTVYFIKSTYQADGCYQDFYPFANPFILTHESPYFFVLNDSLETLLQEEKKEEKSEIYISHSGRQTKRKVYSEEALDVLSLTSKKARSLQTPNKPKSKKMTNDEIIASSSLFRV